MLVDQVSFYIGRDEMRDICQRAVDSGLCEMEEDEPEFEYEDGHYVVVDRSVTRVNLEEAIHQEITGEISTGDISADICSYSRSLSWPTGSRPYWVQTYSGGNDVHSV